MSVSESVAISILSRTMPINWSKPWSLLLGVHRRRFRAVALADHLDEALAGVDLVAEHLAEIAGP